MEFSGQLMHCWARKKDAIFVTFMAFLLQKKYCDTAPF